MSNDQPFSPDEMALVRQGIRKGKAKLECPRCGGPLEGGAPVAGGGTVGFVWVLRCPSCNRDMTLVDTG